jgi:hypothetical protein
MRCGAKVDPVVDAAPIRTWDAWMGKKLAGEAPPDQPPLRISLPEPPTSRDAPPRDTSAAAAALADGVGLAAPQRVLPRRRLVSTIRFEDGSSCDCRLACGEGKPAGGCCDDWAHFCKQPAEIAELSLPACPAPTEVPLASAPPRADAPAVSLTFLNHARYPVKLLYVDADGRAVEVGRVETGHALTFTSAATHAWRVTSFKGAPRLATRCILLLGVQTHVARAQVSR